MPEALFYPYTFAYDALNVERLELVADGKSTCVEGTGEGIQRMVSLAGQRLEQGLSVRAVLTDPNSALAEVIPEGENATALAVLLKVSAPEARVRFAVTATQTENGRWSAAFDLPRSSLVGKLILDPAAVRQKEGRPVPGYATRRSEVVASGTRAVIYIDQHVVLPGSSIDNEWINFASSNDPALKERKDTAWYLDLTAGQSPKLRLNEGIAGLRKALETPQTHGRAARVRDALSHSIVQPVLLVLATEALCNWALEDDAPTYPWQESVLMGLAGHSGNATAEQQLDLWRKRWNGGDRTSVFHDLEAAIQRQLGMPTAASRLVKELEEAVDG